MDKAIGILAQIAPAAQVETQLYSVPRDGHALIQELAVCNRSAGGSRFRISISIRAAATAAPDYLYYDIPIDGNDTFAAELGLTLNAFDVIRVYSSNGLMSFALFGVQT